MKAQKERMVGHGKIEDIMVPPRNAGLNRDRFLLISGQSYTLTKKTTYDWMERNDGGTWITCAPAKFWNIKKGNNVRFVYRKTRDGIVDAWSDYVIVHLNILTDSRDMRGLKDFDNPSHPIYGDEPQRPIESIKARQAVDDLFFDYSEEK